MKLIQLDFVSYRIMVEYNDGIVESYIAQPKSDELEYNWELSGDEFFKDVYKQVRERFIEQMQVNAKISITEINHYTSFTRQRTATFSDNGDMVVYKVTDTTYNL